MALQTYGITNSDEPLRYKSMLIVGMWVQTLLWSEVVLMLARFTCDLVLDGVDVGIAW